jgi:hypothetical protein
MFSKTNLVWARPLVGKCRYDKYRGINCTLGAPSSNLLNDENFVARNLKTNV